MELLPALFGLGCLATIAFAVRTLDGNAMFLSVVLTAVWAASNVGWQADTLGMFPIMDLPFALIALSLWRIERRDWQLAVLMLAVAQLILHVDYAVYGRDFELTYLALLDITFGLQLLAVSSRGIGNVGSDLRRWLRLVRVDRRSPSRREMIGG